MDQAPGWIVATQFASRGVLIVLLGLSVWSVAIIVDRYRVFKSAGRGKAGGSSGEAAGPGGQAGLDHARALIASRNWPGLETWARDTAASNPANLGLRLPAGALRAALETGNSDSESVDRAVRSYLTRERSSLEQGLTALATLGSNAPFIGLFGTVLGIIQAFGSLAHQTGSGGTTSVMTGISEALVATAIGLFVAIPAVIAYNVYSRKLRLILAECDSLRDYYLSRLGGAGAGSGPGPGAKSG